MADKLQRLLEYRMLASEDLSVEDAARVQRMRDQLQPGVPALDERDPYTALAEPVRAELASGGRFRAGIIHNVGADGIAIATEDPPPLEQRVHVHVYDRKGGHAYTVFGRVVARVVKGVPGVSLALEGRPTQTRLMSRTSGIFRSTEPEFEAPVVPKRGRGR